MSTRVFKLRSVRRGEHVHTTVFSGYENQTLANTGTLVQTLGEWQEFGALLLAGAEACSKGYHQFKVLFEGDEEVVGG